MRRLLSFLILTCLLLAACDRDTTPELRPTPQSEVEDTEVIQPAKTSAPTHTVIETPVPTTTVTAIPSTENESDRLTGGDVVEQEDDEPIDRTHEGETDTIGPVSGNGDPLRVLFIGNSYTAYNDLPGRFEALMLAGGHAVDVERSVQGAWSLSTHLMHDGTLDKIAGADWDYVILQEQSVVSHPELGMYPAVRQLDEKIRGVGGETIVFMSWGRREGLPAAGYPDYASIQAQIATNCHTIADELELTVAPVGVAWQNVLALDPHPDLWDPDGTHPSLEGTYLAACVLFTVVSGGSPEGVDYVAGLEEETARLLQRLAADAVEGEAQPSDGQQSKPQNPTPGPTSTTGQATKAALPPVTANEQWEPVIQALDGVPMALVPPGCFVMGSTQEQIDYAVDELFHERSWYDNEQPAYQQCFTEPFWIDVYEVSNEQYGLSGWASGADLPRETVDWFEARLHCERRGARLPTEAEWEYAARGPDGLIFPWGNEFDASLANFCDVNCPFEHRDPDADDGFATLAPVGSYAGGASWVGALDMSGNVWEWTSSIYTPYPYDPDDGREAGGCRTEPGPELNREREAAVCNAPITRVLRGGSWTYPQKHLLRAADRSWYNPDNWEVYYLGFRCARSFSP